VPLSPSSLHSSSKARMHLNPSAAVVAVKAVVKFGVVVKMPLQ
jgi:hypothetical protein